MSAKPYLALADGQYHLVCLNESELIFNSVCPGELFADNGLFIAVANIIAVFNITNAHDSAGKEITPTVSFKPGITRSDGLNLLLQMLC